MLCPSFYEPPAHSFHPMPDLPCTPPRYTRYLLPAILIVALGARLYLLLATHRTAEDFYITLRYAENIAHGYGFVYNSGEHVLGTTTPLYTLCLALIAWLGLDPILWGQLANVAADVGTCFMLWRLGRAIQRPAAGLVAAAIIALWPPCLYWSISGMETSLVTLCGIGVFAAVAERRSIPLALWSAALVLLRVDGLLLVAVAYLGLVAQGRVGNGDTNFLAGEPSAVRPPDTRGLVASIAPFLALTLPWIFFAWLYFGSPIPTSLTAKLAVYAWQSRSTFPNLAPFAKTMTGNPAYWFLLIGAIPGMWAVVTQHRRIAPAAIWTLIYFAGMAFSKSFLFGWYYLPPAPIYALVAVLGWAWMLRGIAQPTGLRGLAGVAGAAFLILGICALPKQARMIAADERADEELLKPIGLALRGLVRPGERVMLEPIGWIGYYSGARVLDAVGLVSPEVIPYFRKGAISPYLDMMDSLKPKWVLLRAGEYEDALAAPVSPNRQLRAHYTLARTFSNPLVSAGSPPAFYLLHRHR